MSGGEDDKAYVWNILDGEVLFECGNHNDSVTCALFSHDGAYVATGDMNGLIQVWKVATQAQVWSFEMGDLNVSTLLPFLCTLINRSSFMVVVGVACSFSHSFCWCC